tara:strand:- start:2773 stop:3003 length:231 start_codon:yes stop_codon:yes gene_type:complete
MKTFAKIVVGIVLIFILGYIIYKYLYPRVCDTKTIQLNSDIVNKPTVSADIPNIDIEIEAPEIGTNPVDIKLNSDL